MDRNDVHISGRVSGVPEEHVMPGGNAMVKWRVSVRRRGRPRRGHPVDVVPCVTFDPAVAAVARELGVGDVIELSGMLRCRVWGPARAKVWDYQVEAASVRRIVALAESPDGSEPGPPAVTAPRPISHPVATR